MQLGLMIAAPSKSYRLMLVANALSAVLSHAAITSICSACGRLCRCQMSR